MNKKQRKTGGFLLNEEICEGMKLHSDINWSGYVRKCLELKLKQLNSKQLEQEKNLDLF